MTITTEDARYEHFVPPLHVPVARRATTWRWEGWNIHVEHVGNDDAPVRVLLVHGAGGNAAAMWPFAARLALIGARVTTLDLPGYGRTTPPVRRDVTLTDWQRVLVDLIRLEADDRPLVLLGASMGGMLALDAAARTVMLPGSGHFPVEEPGFQVLLDEVSRVIADVTARSRGVHVPPPAGSV